MEGKGEMKKQQPGTSRGGADIISGNRGEAVDANSTSVSSVFQPDARVTGQRVPGRRSVPSRYRPPAPKQYDVTKKLSTNREVQEEGSRTSSATDESMTDTTFVTSSVHYGGRHYHTSPAPTDPPREPTIDELFSGEINPDAAHRGDWWRGGLYY
ncbi:uncharacterized protein LOC144572673 isoform X2 [Carex rostrata]